MMIFPGSSLREDGQAGVSGSGIERPAICGEPGYPKLSAGRGPGRDLVELGELLAGAGEADFAGGAATDTGDEPDRDPRVRVIDELTTVGQQRQRVPAVGVDDQPRHQL